MAVELATGYISIVPETSRVIPGVRSALSGVDRLGDEAGRGIGGRMSEGITSSLKNLAVAGAGAAIAKQVFGLGNSFTNELNTMQAVSTATVDQMNRVKEAAKALGDDAQLSNTSATDAAAAMSELAKGGFTVDQSMAAARGTLQLAAAAQIDAASAATIQSQALQAFGLNADYAAQAADVLANTANASSAEMTDVAYGLQAVGTVANQFGLSLEDTAAALGLFANAGITGSDAGTLLKSALLALTDQGKPAQKAIEELGLTVYDAQGKFIGMRALFGQLERASSNMTPEMYQAATATLFGSDAMRLAGIAAEQGATGWDSMRLSVEREGAAAEVAAAKTQGLPGALAAIQNSAETLALEIYDLVDGPLAALASKGAELISTVTPKLMDGFAAVGEILAPYGEQIAGAFDSVAESGKLTEWGHELAEVFGDLAQTGAALVPPIMSIGQALVTAGAAIGIGTWELLLNTLDSIAPILDATLVPALEGVAALMQQNQVATTAFVGGFALFETVPSLIDDIRGPFEEVTSRVSSAIDTVRSFGSDMRGAGQSSRVAGVQLGRFGSAVDRIGQRVPIIGAMQTSFLNAAQSAERFGRTAGAAAAASTGLKAAASGVANAFGGPLVAGIGAAILLGTQLIGAMDDVSNFQESAKKSSIELADAQYEVAEAFARTSGAINDESLKAVEQQVSTFRSTLEQTAADAPGFWADVLAGFGYEEVGRNAREAAQEAGRIAEETSKALNNIEVTDAELAATLAGSDADWAAFITRLRDVGGASDDAVASLQQQREEMLQQREAARNVTPGMVELSDSIKVLADETSSADQKTSALKDALVALGVIPQDAKQALSEYGETISEIVSKSTGAADASDGLGQAMIDANGQLDVLKNAGARGLNDSLQELANKFLQVSTETGNSSRAYQEAMPALQALAEQYNLPIEKIQQFAREAGMAPDVISTLVNLVGVETADQQLAGIALRIAQIDPDKPKTVTVLGLTQDAEDKLTSVGVKVERLPDGTVRVTADTAEALNALADLQRPRDVTLRVRTQMDPAARAAYFGNASVQGPFATGGTIPYNADGGTITGPGTGTSDSILGIDRYTKMPTSWVSAGEEVIREKSASKWRWLLKAINRDDPRLENIFDGLPMFSKGGTVKKALDAAQSVTGNGYEWGGTGPSNFDCSGFMGWLQQILMGASPSEAGGRRLYTTYSLIGGQSAGLEPGPGPAGTVFIVGTSDEHMAGILAGQPVEAGGGHGTSRIGSPAVGAFDGQFHSIYHLPNELIEGEDDLSSSGIGTSALADSPTTKKQEWTEKDQLDLESARVAVIQAQEARDKVYNNPKKSDADKQQADLKVERAELKVRQLEQKRDGVGIAGAISTEPAPPLTGEMGDDAITLRQAEISVLDAQMARDKVYNDPESTSLDKEKADIAVYQAQNSLEETKKRLEEEAEKEASGGGKGTDGFSLKDRLKKFGSDLAGIAVDAFFEIVGFESRWLDIPIPEYKAPTKGSTVNKKSGTGKDAPAPKGIQELLFPLQNIPGSFPLEDLQRQAPMTPGTPGWVEAWLKVLPKDAKLPLHDDGGWLMPGLNLNLTTKPEPVLNPKQLDALYRVADAGAVQPQVQPVAPSDFSVKIYNPTFANQSQFLREANAMQERQMMRHAGRPL